MSSSSVIVSLPPNFLSHSENNITVTRIDFSQTPTPKYASLYACILDNALSADECAQLVAYASSTCGGQWEQAKINRGSGKDAELNTERRKCERIVLDDADLASRIWARVRDHVPELIQMEGRAEVTGPGPVKRGEVWKAERLNERMRFLKYGPGEYFRKHFDGTFADKDDARSMFTLHLYLNESDEENPLVGGATTFHDPCTCGKGKWESCDCETGKFDVEPRVGRVLLFQQRGLEHSGADVSEGLKMTMRTDLLFKKV